MSLDVQVVNRLDRWISDSVLMPRLLNYVVAIYLMVIGVLGLAHHFNMERRSEIAVRSVAHFW